MPFSLPELIAAVKRFVQDNLPGCTASDLDITLRGEDKPFHVPLLTSCPATPVPPARPDEELAWVEEEKTNHHKPLVHPCITAILTVLRQAGPLTRTRLFAAMDKHAREQRLTSWSEATIKIYLKILMDDETIENPPGARPPGYRLTDSESTSDTNHAEQ